MKTAIIIFLFWVNGLLLFRLWNFQPIIQDPVIRTVYNNKIIISPLVENELKQIFSEIAKTGYEIKDVKTLRPYAPGVFSWHNYGLAVDINPEQNPCIGEGCTDAISADFKGWWVAGKNGALTKSVVDIFKKQGWCWGGDWCGKKDYMHFSKPFGLPDHDECRVAKCPYFK